MGVPVSTETGRLGKLTQQPGVAPQSWPELEAALRRSQDYLLDIQRPEGFWVGELMVDSTLVSDTIAYHHWNGKVDPEWQRKAVNHILSMQLPDGGWNIYYGGPSEVNATIKAPTLRTARALLRRVPISSSRWFRTMTFREKSGSGTTARSPA